MVQSIFNHIAIWDTKTIGAWRKKHPEVSEQELLELWWHKRKKLEADAVIVRDSDQEENSFHRALRMILDMPDVKSIRVLTNFREVKYFEGTSGIHFKRGNPSKDIPKGIICGISAHSKNGVIQAAVNGMDYAILSPVFPTSSHPGETSMGVEKFSKICTLVEIPVFALGGITIENRELCKVAGAHGTAAISLYMP
ncbi:MAG: hypothetical protein EBS07_00255 [Sphingobacteriia bacterium]|nr:hypothetical protein [Sphingobacteriia bacterium]